MVVNIKKTFGHIELHQEGKACQCSLGKIVHVGNGSLERQRPEHWCITEAKPHICIKLKAIFSKIPKNAVTPFSFVNTPEACTDLLWFMKRYPLSMSSQDFDLMADGQSKHDQNVAEMEEILLPSYTPSTPMLRNGFAARDYQRRAADLYIRTKRLLLGDDIGLGKTLSAILSFFNENTLPAVVAVQTHLTRQWRDEIEKFTDHRVHIIQGTKPYSLPTADVYVIKYSCLSGWVNIFETGFFKSVVFDEVQELRRQASAKYGAAEALSNNVKYAIGLSATPIYNYGSEIFAVLNLLKPGCLGEFMDFQREWCKSWGTNYVVSDPDALGTYLRDNYLLLRRNRAEVGQELPMINRIVHYVDYSDIEVKKSENLAKQLAMKVLNGSFTERGQAAREFDMLMRHNTGVAKANSVAEYVKILLENKEPVVLALWHRDVYDIVLDVLKDYKPVMYTGSESEAQKQRAKDAFLNGETDLFIISLRSGIGLDGLQKRCHTIVIGELDWSPQVHEQLIGRVDRAGQEHQVTAIFLVTDAGSDPVIIDVLGLKSSQSHSILNPLSSPVQTVNDDSRIKQMAEKFLNKSSKE